MTGSVADNVTDPLALAAQAHEQLFHTRTGTKLHIRACSHLSPDSDLIATTPADAAVRQLCSECEAELTGHGRTPYVDLDRAMEALPVPVQARPRVREVVADTDPDRIWIPYSRSYVALGRPGQRTVYIGKTYVIDGHGTLITLPGYTAGGGGRTTSGADRSADVCPTCGMVKPRTGVCDNC